MNLQATISDSIPRITLSRIVRPERGQVIAGVRFDLLDYDQALRRVQEWHCRGERGCVQFFNPHSVMLCRRDRELSRAASQAALTLPDGTGIILAARLLGLQERGRVTGPTFMLRMCEWGRQHHYRHFFYGGGPGVAQELRRRLTARYPRLRVVGTCEPPFGRLTPAEDEAIVESINAARPDIVWVGLGAPKQEKWMIEHRPRLDATAIIGVGAAFDFHSGSVPWAPAWIRRIGMEWAWRLACEPRRMWRRNLDSPLFLAQVVRQRMARLPEPQVRIVEGPPFIE